MQKKIGKINDADFQLYLQLGVEERELVKGIGEIEVEKKMMIDRVIEIVQQRQRIVKNSIPEGTESPLAKVDTEGNILVE